MSIVVEHLTKRYGSQTAVDNISFEIKTGEVVGFLGPNGAGKSTTMKIITGFMSPNQGDVRLNNFSVRQQPEEVKKRIGYLPEHNPLYLDMSIVDYLRFCAEIQGVEKTTINARVKEMIERCGLTPERYKKIGELSKGFRQRVGLAQAIIHNPEVLILDEPTTGLDPNQIIEIRKLIKELGKEKTVILSSHILSEVEATCDRIIIINKGKIVADGTAATLRTQAQGKEVLTVAIEADGGENGFSSALLELPTVESIKALDGKKGYFQVVSKPEKSSRRGIFELCVRNNWYLTELHGTETSLEDIFRELTN